MWTCCAILLPMSSSDSFLGLFSCLGARILGVPLASVLQGNFHPASDGFLWWKAERPAGLPSALAGGEQVAANTAWGGLARCVDLLAGANFP